MSPTTITQQTCARIPAEEGNFQLCYYSNSQDSKEHLALVMGEVAGQEEVLVRVHSECFTGDVLGSLRCDCGPQLHEAMRRVAEAGQGVLIYLRQEGRGIGLLSKLRAYNLQDQGYDTVDANLALGHQADEREYSMAALILADLGVRSIRLLTNNPAKIESLRALGVKVTDRVPMPPQVTSENAVYLTTKVRRMRHLLNLDRPASSAQAGDGLDPSDLILAGLKQEAAAHHARTGRPLVTLTYAQSLDGSIAAQPGRPLALSGPESLAMTHRLRTLHDAILVGIGTVLADNPRLTVRLADGPTPQPVILDSHLRTPPDAALFNNPTAPWIFTADPVDADRTVADRTVADRRRRLEENGARVFVLPSGGDEGVDLGAALKRLGDLGIHSLMVEGGAQIIRTVLAHGLADHAVITVAPVFIGGLNAYGAQTDQNIPQIAYPSVVQLGRDTVIWGKLMHG